MGREDVWKRGYSIYVGEMVIILMETIINIDNMYN